MEMTCLMGPWSSGQAVAAATPPLTPTASTPATSATAEASGTKRGSFTISTSLPGGESESLDDPTAGGAGRSNPVDLVAAALRLRVVELLRKPPSRCDDLVARIEPDAVLARRVQVAEERGLSPRGGEERHRGGHSDVHVEHPRLRPAL